MSIVCQTCNCENEEGSEFCVECGTQLQVAEMYAEEAVAEGVVDGEEAQYVEHAHQEAEQELETPPGNRFDALFKASTRSELSTEPLPEVGPYATPPQLTIYFQNEMVGDYELIGDIAMMGRSDSEKEYYPDLDLTGLDPNQQILARRHCVIYRQNKNFTLQVPSTGAVQLNNEMLSLGDKRKLTFGDVIILGGQIAMKFEMVN